MEHNKEKTHTQHHGAHSGSRTGLSDYNDGGDLSHYGGNDDIHKHERIRISEEEQPEEVGKIAYGNDNETEDEDYGKSHSGL